MFRQPEAGKGKMTGRKIARRLRIRPYRPSWRVAVWPELTCRGTLMAVEISPELEEEFLGSGWWILKQEWPRAESGN